VSPKLLKADDVAALLSVRKDYVYKLVREESIPHVRLGRSVRFRAEAVEDWLKAVERGSLPVNENGRGAALTAPGPDPRR
jgi:excisionase family DNA binding protein